MQVLSLTLKGFRGIRDGLRRDTLTLDFEALAGDAALVAIVGGNGRGKTTLMDNMHPYLTMPSRAMAAGPGGFAYYDHVCLPESEKDLLWAHDGVRYRSQVVIRAGARRRTEAFLFEQSGGAWRPLQLPDGTVSDGKVDTYTRCVEAVCGSADTFFTSVFSAQGKRQLTHYRNAEIKTLLADLLGQEEIQALGQKAGEVARILKAGLASVRQELAGLDDESRRVGDERRRVEGAETRIAQALAARAAADSARDAARTLQAQLVAEREQTVATQAQRRRLVDERQAAIEAGTQGMAALDTQDRQEQERMTGLGQRIAERVAQVRKQLETLERRRQEQLRVLVAAPAVLRAARVLPRAQRVLSVRTDRVGHWRQQVKQWTQCVSARTAAQLRLAQIEREAGQAVLRTEELARRLSLTGEVPCAGSDLQGRCKLLADAHEAHALVPSAQAEIYRLAVEKGIVRSQLHQSETMSEVLADAPGKCARAERQESLARERVSRLALLAARAEEIDRARAEVAAVEQELAALAATASDEESPDERTEREGIASSREQIAVRRLQQAQQTRERLDRLDAALAALPAPFAEQALVAANDSVARAMAALSAAEQAHLIALRDGQSWEAATRQLARVVDRREEVAARLARVESALGGWTLFARCMCNDGLIALAIDDAGPALSGLANDLLLACYGLRFTVSIRTLVETGKGDQKEGFDIVVHDGDSGDSKSVSLMSGGERVWINECLTRAVALYLARHSGRRYGTLFSDEADGALDAERKRMFMAMKREVLRLGAYEREFFVSQTPELTAMADVVVNLDEWAAAASWAILD
jgi:DNA repair protein SbcC/Rad50